MTGLLWLGLVAGMTTLAVWFFQPHKWPDTYAAITRTMQPRPLEHRLYVSMEGPERCYCGELWPCLDSVPADRRTISP
jgi:hypothetical protein